MGPTRLHGIRFPGESEQYRAARDELLRAEIALRRSQEEVAEKRRALPPGGKVPEDYVFEERAADPSGKSAIRKVRLSELFGTRDTLVLYSFMYGPAMKRACPNCTSILDALDGEARHIDQRVSFAVVAKSPLPRIESHAKGRGWRSLRLLSSAGNTYNHDYQGEDETGDQNAAVNVFVRRDGETRHFYYTELSLVPPEPEQDPRHVDAIWPLWSLLDYTPEGRGSDDWHPSLSYGTAKGSRS
jgi:predicted dithiol-disulfide oxidoreductase (DUF899 family)